MSQPKTITLDDGKEITIALLPLRAYGEFLIALQDVLKEIADEWAGVSNQDILAKVPAFIASHVDEAAQIIAIGVRGQLTAKEIADERGLSDAIELLTAVIEVNDVEKIVGTVKKAMALFKAKQAATTAEVTNTTPASL